MQVKEAMVGKDKVVTVKPAVPMSDAAQLMLHHDVSSTRQQQSVAQRFCLHVRHLIPGGIQSGCNQPTPVKLSSKLDLCCLGCCFTRSYAQSSLAYVQHVRLFCLLRLSAGQLAASGRGRRHCCGHCYKA